jgi:hypothetical protein
MVAQMCRHRDGVRHGEREAAGGVRRADAGGRVLDRDALRRVDAQALGGDEAEADRILGIVKAQQNDY